MKLLDTKYTDKTKLMDNLYLFFLNWISHQKPKENELVVKIKSAYSVNR